MFSRSPRYFYDAEAVRQPHKRDWTATTGGLGSLRHGDDWQNGAHGGVQSIRTGKDDARLNDAGANLRNFWLLGPEPSKLNHYAAYPTELVRRCILAGSRPGDVVLDPFLGSGTTALVADRLGRDAIGIELNPEYAEMARKRIDGDEMLFSEPVIVETPQQVEMFGEVAG
jgi:hypothetical protein